MEVDRTPESFWTNPVSIVWVTIALSVLSYVVVNALNKTGMM